MLLKFAKSSINLVYEGNSINWTKIEEHRFTSSYSSDKVIIRYWIIDSRTMHSMHGNSESDVRQEHR